MGRAKHGNGLQHMKMSEDSKQKHMRFLAVYISGGLGCLACVLAQIIAWQAGLTSSQLGSFAGISWLACAIMVPVFALFQLYYLTPFFLFFGFTSTLAFCATVVHAGFTEFT
mmetsp:Transcript_16168/g.37365  ORF Transcript_16168/g.37365 Transcript_16168/m.37365 type:complete len:112 (+) Transcript_16168:249-584(+)